MDLEIAQRIEAGKRAVGAQTALLHREFAGPSAAGNPTARA